mmetsp:Transcript_7171/g.11836  ORF Transcript_7171/g.11836 Transcript_7171/m.11836 type:complete len:96 (-) Transcript_7171:224-511(-)
MMESPLPRGEKKHHQYHLSKTKEEEEEEEEGTTAADDGSMAKVLEEAGVGVLDGASADDIRGGWTVTDRLVWTTGTVEVSVENWYPGGYVYAMSG